MQNLEKILEEIEMKKKKCLDIVRVEIDPMEITIHREQYKGLRMAEDIIRKYMNDGWILVEERLPEESEEFNDRYDPVSLAVIDTEWHKESDVVQITVHDKGKEEYLISADYTYDGEWAHFGGMKDTYDVIAWKPLSEPYIPEEIETRKELERSEGE